MGRGGGNIGKVFTYRRERRKTMIKELEVAIMVVLADGGMDGVDYANDSKIAWFSLNGLVNGLDHERNIFLMA